MLLACAIPVVRPDGLPADGYLEPIRLRVSFDVETSAQDVLACDLHYSCLARDRPESQGIDARSLHRAQVSTLKPEPSFMGWAQLMSAHFSPYRPVAAATPPVVKVSTLKPG